MIASRKYFLDTSIFYESIKLGAIEFEAKLKRCAPGRRYAAHYVAIELNRGLLYLLVQHYRNVERMENVPRALVELSNQFGREPKVGLIVHGYILRRFGRIEGDHRYYLVQLELAIADINDRLAGLVKSFIGSFGDYPAASLTTYSREDYDGLVEACDGSRDVACLADFWAGVRPVVGRMIVALEAEEAESNRKLSQAKTELLEFLQLAIGSGQPGKYKSIGDLIIAIECPGDCTLVANDRFFPVLAGLLGKDCGLWVDTVGE